MSLLMYEGRGVMVVKTVCFIIVLTADAFRKKGTWCLCEL